MSENNNSQNTDIDDFVSNTFGERYLFAINRNVFEDTNASTVFRSHFGDSIFREKTFYVIAGTDSGLLYQYIKTQGVPKGSRYLFVELPQVLDLLEDVDGSEELAVTTGEDWQEQAKNMGAEKFATLDRMILNRSLGVSHGHCSDYPPFWHRLKEEFDAFCFSQKVFLDNHFATICQINNLTENQTPAICLKNAFKGKTAVLLAGGPSLDALLPWVKQHRSNLLVIAVSRISHSLLQADIQPDICVSIDPQPLNLYVSRDMLKFQNGTLLINNNHVSPGLLSSWGGKKMFIGPRFPWASSLEPENLPVSDGTTVTDSAFGLAVEMGVAQIVLGGADFCYSQEGYTHASDSAERTTDAYPLVIQQQVLTNSGVMADTLHAYQKSAMSIDLQAEEAIALGCHTINPAPGAMRLPHIEHLDLSTIQIEPLAESARDTLSACMPSSNNNYLGKNYKKILGEVDRVLKEVKAIKELSSKALIYNRKLFAKDESDSGIHNKEKLNRIDKQFNGKYAGTTTFIRQFGVSHFLPMLLLDHNNNVENIEESYRLDHQAFVKTSDELINTLHQARARILSRLEEEKSHPNVKLLLKQWIHDLQPGRAIQWALHHTDCVKQLPNEQQQKLYTFQDSFDDSLDNILRNYVGTDYSNIINTAQGCFMSRDQDGLLRILSKLEAQGAQNTDVNSLAIVQGYLAELRNKPTEAINAYQSITEGAAHLNALTRLFELHSKAQDLEQALDVLKTLSDMNPVYCPMYADMLHATGDIDAAVEIYTNHVLANPDDLDTMMSLGKLFQQCGSAEGILWTMSYILGKDPDNKAAQKILNEVEIKVED